jgi:putative ABC transport system permease protein
VLGGAVLVAGVAFVLLASAAKTSELKVRGSVTSAFRPAYDILVRPYGSQTALERSERLVRPNFLSGVYGGITFKQWHAVEHLHGVSAAAPVANIGYILPFGNFRISISNLVTRAPFQLYRLRQTWIANGGLSRYPGPDLYVYYTPGDLFTSAGKGSPWVETGPNLPRPLPSCEGFGSGLPLITPSPFPPLGSESTFTCFPSRWEALGEGAPTNVNGFDDPRSRTYVGTKSFSYFPVYISAIDPVQEAKLVGLDRTIVHGRYLRPNEGLRPYRVGTRTTFTRLKVAPVLASTRTYIDERLDVSVERLRIPPGTNVPRLLSTGACTVPQYPCPAALPPPPGSRYRGARAFVDSLPGKVVGHRSIPLRAFYRNLLRTPQAGWKAGTFTLGSYWTTSPTRYRRLGRERLAPLAVRNPTGVWKSGSSNFYTPPLDNLDPQFRRLHDRVSTNLLQGNNALYPALRVVGEFDPAKLPSFSPLSKVPLETYAPPELLPGDPTASRILHGRPLLPDQNLAGYIQPPPLFLTTMQGLQAFLDPQAWHSPSVFHSEASAIPAAQRQAPISAIRVKVAGVTGPDPLSIERIRTVALQIHERTGLAVDVTAGSSPHPVLIDLPKGRFGRPRLLLREGWSKKGVSVSFLNAVDAKSLALFSLIPIICAFFLANSALAAVRGRRGEIGTLLTLGWRRGAIFRVVLGEIGLVGLAAGLVGSGLAALIVSLFTLDAPLWASLLVLPLALCLALLAGLLPAWRAAHGTPLDAIRPAIAGRERSGHAHRMLSLALVNLRRVPARTLVGALALAVGVAALTLLVAINQAFQGTLVGTLLGNAISIQIHSFDFAAVGLTIGLAALALADVLYLNLRERQAELVTLRTVGWADRHLARMIALEALLLGGTGSLLGALTGSALAAGFLSLPAGSLTLAALAAAAGGLTATLLASLLPLSQIRRLTIPTALAEE